MSIDNRSLNFWDPFKISEIDAYPDGDIKLLVPPVKAKRINFRGDRFYYYTAEDFVSDFYKSVTTATKHGFRTPFELLKWYAEKGWEGSLRILREKRTYGTFDHIVKAEFSAKVMASGSQFVNFSVEDLRRVFNDYREKLGLNYNWGVVYFDRLCRSLAAWRKFFLLFEVQPLLIEKTLFNFDEANPHRNFAGTLDLSCFLTIGDRYKSGANKWDLKPEKTAKFEPKSQVLAVLDNKSRINRNGIYDAGVLQLEALGQAFEYNFGKRPDLLLHFNPTDWRSRPDFVLDEVDPEHVEIKNLDAILSIAHNRINAKGPIGEQPYKTTIEGYFQDDAETGFRFNTLTVRQAIETYENGRAAELNLGPDDELQAENSAALALRETFQQAKEI